MRQRNSLLTLSALAAAVAAALVVCPAAQTTPQEREQRTMRTVASTLDFGHVSGQRLDDTISRRALEIYLKSLDPMKSYFLQSDIDRIDRDRDRLDDMLKAGDPSFAHAVFELFLDRLDERTELVRELLREHQDFTVDESFVTDPDDRQYARDGDEAREQWRRRVKYDLLVQKAAGTAGEEAIDRVQRRYDLIKKRMHELRSDEVLALFLSSAAGSYDPHTSYLSPRVLEDFEIQMRLNYQGIGARLREEDGFAVIESIMSGGAAEKDGKLQPGDRIARVGAESGELEDVAGMRLSDVVDRVRGEEGTVVRLGILPAAGGEMRIYSLVRAKTELRDQTARGEVMDLGGASGGDASRVGVIALSSFYAGEQHTSTKDIARLLGQFKRDGVDAVVLDLRYNGGGLLSEAVGVTGLFIDQGPVVMVRDGDGRVRCHRDDERGTLWDGPLVVLTSRFSASASEIVAGAIKDYRRGLVVGDPSTHGKGTVQQVLALGPPQAGLGAIKLTIQQFYRPSGMSTQERGVHADVELPAISSALSLGESELPHALAFDRIEGFRHADYLLVDDQIVSQVAAASRARCLASQDFATLRADCERVREIRKQSRAPLEEKKFLAERSSRQKPGATEPEPEPGEGITRDAYLEEVLAIAGDYARCLQSRRA